ncbi:MAG: integrase family protein [Gammaproteobacteria bacterium]|nr:integrase family protein [Gammaproteobacteria bacterium]
MRITKTFVDHVLPSPRKPNGKRTQSFYRDSTIPGFALRVTTHGAKSFIVEKRIGNKVKRITLGRYGNLTVEQAKKEAMKVLGKVASGRDPIAEKKQARLEVISLGDTFDDYLKTRKDLKTGTVHDYTRSINWACQDWLNKPLTGISKDMVEMRHRDLGKRSHARANNAMRVLRALFNHARNKYDDAQGNPIILVNPVDHLSRNRAWYKIERRQTLIKPHQLRDWYEATLQLNNITTRDYLHLLLFTGLRRSEAARLEWSEVDFKDRTVTLLETKNHCIHTLPLSPFLEELLQRRFEERTSPFVFPTNAECGHLTEPRTAVERVADLSGVPFTLHDLRRTFITIAESLDIPGYALKRLLNHKDPNDVTAGYIISSVERLRGPMNQIAAFIVSHIEVPEATRNESPNDAEPWYLKEAANG